MTRKQKKSNGNSSGPGKNRPLLWEPKTKAQLWALNSRAEILLFGGAAGSLKTETLVMDAVREADENLSWARAQMRGKGIRQRPCTGAVARIAACLAETPDASAGCDERSMIVFTRVERDVVREGPPKVTR